MTRMIPQAAAHWQAHTSSTCDMSESVATAHLSVGPSLRRAPARPGFTDYPVVISRPTPTLPDANLRYQDAPNWRKWTKSGWDFPFLSTQF